MTQTQPLVSVVMATYNEPPAFIIEAVQSVLNQTLGDFEFLLIDDSTHIETATVIDVLVRSDSRIRLIRGEERFGFARALNIGLKEARGKYIARMDGDDVSRLNRFELQVAFLENNPDIVVVGGAMDIINEVGKVTSHRNYATGFFKVILFALVRSPLAHPTVMFRREVVEKGFFYDETFQRAEDLELWLRLINNGYRISNVLDTVLSYRVKGNLAYKRTGEHFVYNYRARKKNFSWGTLFFSIVSVLVSRIYTILPMGIAKFFYGMENG
jgi:glycosyltransferase involved in cell wall biosynthesis